MSGVSTATSQHSDLHVKDIELYIKAVESGMSRPRLVSIAFAELEYSTARAAPGKRLDWVNPDSAELTAVVHTRASALQHP